MNKFRAILYGTYVVLIMLLCISAMKMCSAPAPNQRDVSIEVPDTGDIRKALEVGGSGKLKITLLWDCKCDFDLHIKQPNGREIFYGYQNDYRSGGALDDDNTSGGRNSGENIVWQNPPRGRYKATVKYFSSNGDNGGPFKVIVQQEGQQPKMYSSQLTRVKETIFIDYINI